MTENKLPMSLTIDFYDVEGEYGYSATINDDMLTISEIGFKGEAITFSIPDAKHILKEILERL